MRKIIKGLFIPKITAEMFRNGYLESIEALMAEGEIYDIEYSRWIPVSEQMPEDGQIVLFCDIDGDIMMGYYIKNLPKTHFIALSSQYEYMKNVRAWMPLPDPYKMKEEA